MRRCSSHSRILWRVLGVRSPCSHGDEMTLGKLLRVLVGIVTGTKAVKDTVNRQ